MCVCMCIYIYICIYICVCVIDSYIHLNKSHRFNLEFRVHIRPENRHRDIDVLPSGWEEFLKLEPEGGLCNDPLYTSDSGTQGSMIQFQFLAISKVLSSKALDSSHFSLALPLPRE